MSVRSRGITMSPAVRKTWADDRSAVGTSPALSSNVTRRFESTVSSAHFLISHVACAHRSHETHAESAACRYRVAWSINPHMRVGATDFSRAQEQHADFVNALRRESARVDRLAFVHGAYDSVFAKDSAVLVAHDGHRRALLAAPLHPERQREQQARARALTQLGFVVERCETALEGGDVVVGPNLCGAFLGHGVRSSRESALRLSTFLRTPVTPIELVNPHLFHLDVALAVLDDGTALASQGAFTAEGARALREHPSIARVEEVPEAEARAFGLNLVQVGDAVILGSRAPMVERILASRGLRVVHKPLNQFQLAGGSAACLVARVHSSTGAEQVSTFAPPWASAG